MVAAGKTETSNLPLHTNDPVALAYLMSETLFAIPGEENGRAETTIPASETVTPAAAPAMPVAVTPVEAPPEAVAPEITYLGKNQSGFLFVFQDQTISGQHHLPPQEMEAFERILAALDLSIDHIALINIADHQISLSTLLTFFNPQRMILLGTRLTLSGVEQLPDPLTPHRAVTYQQTAFLHTFSFSEMMSDTDRKRMFWNSLKAMINP